MKTKIVFLSFVINFISIVCFSANFVDVTEISGITAITHAGSRDKNHLIESVGCGAAFFDYDNDGDVDLYLVNGWQIRNGESSIRGRNVLYRNNGDGTFENVTQKANVGDDRWGIGVCVADFDDDGWLDLYVTNFGSNCLYRNNRDGTFNDIADQANVADRGWSCGATFFDGDLDGDLDLYVANYVDCTLDEILNAERSLSWQGVANVMIGPRGLIGGPDTFFRNNGDGTFTDATAESGLIDVGPLYGLGVCSTDYDLDGDVDLFVANDAGPNYLYQNSGDGTFIEIGTFVGVSYSDSGSAQACMGVDFADFDNDRDLDGFVTNFTGENSTLYKNSGSGDFTDATRSESLWQPTFLPMSWGTGFFDFDLDGDLDLFIANGHIYPQVDDHPEYAQTYDQLNQLFENSEIGFREITTVAGDGFRVRRSSRGTAFADIDNDGDLDILITNIDAPPTLLRNENQNQNNWLIVDVSEIGAIIHVKTGDLIQIREIRSGNSYVSQNDLRAHFGLGGHEKVDRVEVKWRSGEISVLTDVPTRQILKIEKRKNR